LHIHPFDGTAVYIQHGTGAVDVNAAAGVTGAAFCLTAGDGAAIQVKLSNSNIAVADTHGTAAAGGGATVDGATVQIEGSLTAGCTTYQINSSRSISIGNSSGVNGACIEVDRTAIAAKLDDGGGGAAGFCIGAAIHIRPASGICAV